MARHRSLRPVPRRPLTSRGRGITTRPICPGGRSHRSGRRRAGWRGQRLFSRLPPPSSAPLGFESVLTRPGCAALTLRRVSLTWAAWMTCQHVQGRLAGLVGGPHPLRRDRPGRVNSEGAEAAGLVDDAARGRGLQQRQQGLSHGVGRDGVDLVGLAQSVGGVLRVGDQPGIVDQDVESPELLLEIGGQRGDVVGAWTSSLRA